MKPLWKISVLLLVLQPLWLWAEVDQRDVDNYDNPDSIVMSINQVPKLVLNAALQAKPGIYLNRVVRDLEADDDYYYTFEGTMIRSYWIIVVRADGTLMKVREEEDRPRNRRD